MSKVRKILSLLLMILLLGTVGCAAKPPIEGIEPISEEEIRERIRQAEESALAAETEETTNTETSSHTTVYWTDSGQVWHTDPACASLKRAKAVRTGTVEEALDAGKSRICSYCESE